MITRLSVIAKRIADRIAMDAGKNYPREALEAAKGIETVLEYAQS